jgi:hypothetical protein
MQILVRLGTTEKSSAMTVSVPSADWSITEVMAEVRRGLPKPLLKLLNHSERYGSELFLAKNPDGPERLSESKRLRDYGLSDGCTLWLMCAPRIDQRR